MSLFATATLAAGRLFPGAEEIPFDDKGYTTIDPIFPPLKELIPGTLASVLVFSLLAWKAGPIIRKSFRDRTARIQKELDDAAAAKTAAEAEAVKIRQAQGDIEAERGRELGVLADPAQRDEETVAIRELGRTVAAHEGLLSVLLPVGDGLLCAKKVWSPDDED